MAPSVIGAVLRRWAGDLSQANEPLLRAILRVGTPRDRIRAARLLPGPSLRPWLADPVPGVRRAVAWSLGCTRTPDLREVLLERLTGERMDAVRFELAVAAVRCGAGVASTRVLLGAGPDFLTTMGSRAASDWVGLEAADLDQRFEQALNTDAAEVRHRLGGDDSPLLLLALALAQDPADLPRLADAADGAGRRSRHVAIEALGVHGDPRALPLLKRVLEDTSTDPGFGFRSRLTAALAVGRMGDPDALPWLVGALRNEAADYEGRPGSGLGMQAPVRAALLHAIGEVGNPAGRRVVAPYLAHTHGGGSGGLHLPAMVALVKLGGVDEARGCMTAEEPTAVHALSVLAALGRYDLVEQALSDPRPLVASAAHALQAASPARSTA